MAGRFTQQHPTRFENVLVTEPTGIKSGHWINTSNGKKPTSATERPVGVAQHDAILGDMLLVAVEGCVGVQVAVGPINALQVGTTTEYNYDSAGSTVFVQMATGTNVGMTIAQVGSTPTTSSIAYVPQFEWSAPVTPTTPQFMEVTII